jgi:hypothetical protein
MTIIPMVLWLVFCAVLALVVGYLVAGDGAVDVVVTRRRPRSLKRRLWVGLGLDRAALDRVREAGRSDSGAGTVRPITSGAVRCSAWRGRPHAQACNRLFEEIHRLDRRLGLEKKDGLLYRQIGSETRMKNIGLNQQEKEMRT